MKKLPSTDFHRKRLIFPMFLFLAKKNQHNLINIKKYIRRGKKLYKTVLVFNLKQWLV